MSRKIIKCAKCQNNAETQPKYNEWTETYPIRDKDGQIYCWDCYKGFSVCEGCQKSVANLKLPKSGNPYYPHVSGYRRNCERVSNEVNFICSKKCAENIAARKYQGWKDKLSQGWTRCEECVKFWIDGESNEEGGEWLKEEKHQWKVIKLAQPGQGKWCPNHKSWEEGGKQRYEQENVEYQKRWVSLSNEEKLSEVKKSYRHGENITEIVARSEIPPLVLSKWREKDNHRRYNCPNCQLDNQPTSNDNLTVSTNENNSENSQQPGKEENNSKNQSTQGREQSKKNLPGNSSAGWIVGGVVIFSLTSLIALLVIKRKKSKK